MAVIGVVVVFLGGGFQTHKRGIIKLWLQIGLAVAGQGWGWGWGAARPRRSLSLLDPISSELHRAADCD